MHGDVVDLPSAYHLVEVAESGDLRALAAQAAMDGGSEGTLIWLKRQISGHEWDGRPWHSQDGDLHCAVLLEPDFEPHRYGEMVLVACMSMGQALAHHLSPMIALGYHWPDKLMIANHVVGRVWVQYGFAPHPWLSVSSSVNILNSPEDLSILAISVREAEGTTELHAQQLLQSFSREFITWLNNWHELGFAALVDKWRIRGNRLGSDYAIGSVSGVVGKIEHSGNLLIKNEGSNKLETIRLESYAKCYENRTS